MAHTAYLHQSSGLLLHTLCTVNNQDYTVNSTQCTVCVFGKILMPRGVQYIYTVIIVLKCHNTGGNRDSPLPLNLHKVRCC